MPESASLISKVATDKTKQKKRCVLEDPLFIASLDRTNTSSREAMNIVAPAFRAAGVDVSDMTLSTSSIHRARKRVRQSIVDSQKQKFERNTLLVAHFDGKLLPDVKGRLCRSYANYCVWM